MAREVRAAARARDEMLDNYLDVILIPAPDPRHPGHMIRVAVNRNPIWYQTMAARRMPKCASFRKTITRMIGRLLSGWYDPQGLEDEFLREYSR